ncbi:MAG: helix-turn-helix domain-containing protein [Planctomycetes bacterium]|nr:helix-turn-helix domain-containing protein [Planctomycetota bacterium]
MARRAQAAATEPPSPNRKGEYLTVEKLSEILDVHEDTVRSMIAKGVLPGARIGRRLYVRRVALDARFIAAEQDAGIEKYLP